MTARCALLLLLSSERMQLRRRHIYTSTMATNLTSPTYPAHTMMSANNLATTNSRPVVCVGPFRAGRLKPAALTGRRRDIGGKGGGGMILEVVTNSYFVHLAEGCGRLRPKPEHGLVRKRSPAIHSTQWTLS
jgi:hypothetical protein